MDGKPEQLPPRMLSQMDEMTWNLWSEPGLQLRPSIPRDTFEHNGLVGSQVESAQRMVY